MKRKLGKVRLPANALWVTSHWVAGFSHVTYICLLCGIQSMTPASLPIYSPEQKSSQGTPLQNSDSSLPEWGGIAMAAPSAVMLHGCHEVSSFIPLCVSTMMLCLSQVLSHGVGQPSLLEIRSQGVSLILLCSLSQEFGSSNEKPKTRVVIAISLGTIGLIFGAPTPWYIPIGKAQGLGFSHHH